MPNPVNKPIIAVDIDDVLAEHIEDFIRFSNAHHGTNSTPADYLEKWSDFWEISHEEVSQRATQFLIPEYTDNFGVVKDAKAVLKRLKKNYNLVIVSARPKMAVDSGHNWIDKHFPEIFSEIHFVPTWDPGPKISKAEICKEIGADYLIDDLIRHCNLAAEMGIQAIWFERIGWKQPDAPHPDLVRVNNWQEVLEYFDGKS